MKKNYKNFLNLISMGIGDWGLGIGDWGLGPIPIIYNKINNNTKIYDYFKN